MDSLAPPSLLFRGGTVLTLAPPWTPHRRARDRPPG